jgi:hypothetical protein
MLRISVGYEVQYLCKLVVRYPIFTHPATNHRGTAGTRPTRGYPDAEFLVSLLAHLALCYRDSANKTRRNEDANAQRFCLAQQACIVRQTLTCSHAHMLTCFTALPMMEIVSASWPMGNAPKPTILSMSNPCSQSPPLVWNIHCSATSLPKKRP